MRAAIVSAVLLSLLLSLCAGPALAQGPPLHALVLTSTGEKFDPQVVEYFEQQGISLVTRPLADPLSLELLGLFDLVMLCDFSGLQMPFFHDGTRISQYFTTQRNLEVLRRYVEDGGGLFLSPWMTGGGLQVAEGVNDFLAPWGAQLLAANARDDAHLWTSYSWTTNFANHPVTAGVKTLFYPVEMGRWDDAYPTTPFNLTDARWQPVVRGMPGGEVMQCLQYKDWFPLPGAQNPPILAAAAQIGKGRAVLLGINAMYTFFYPYADVPTGGIGEFHTGQIAGILMEKGDGQTPSDGRLLLRNSLRWLGEGARAQGLGGYTEDKYKSAAVPEPAPVPKWLTGWYEGNEATPQKVLIGARSAYSRGQGTIAEWAAAAKAAGYAVLVMTEDLDAFSPEKWTQFVADCRAASSPDLAVMPGLDLQDAYGNRLLLFGQVVFPKPWMLTPDGKAMQQVQYLMLGFGTCHSAIAHPSSCPLPQELFKFFSGVVVYTYDAEGRLIDDGMQAYQEQIYNTSQPVPLAVHEVYAPDQVAKAAESGHQLYVLADTPEHAAWYMRDGMSHFWEQPVKFLVSSGPMIRALHGGGLVAESEVPLTEARVYSQYEMVRRWKLNATSVNLTYSPSPGNLHLSFFWLQDAQGRTAITPPLRSGTGHGYNWRCSDRQNFFTVAVNYTGTILSDGVDIWLPTFGTDEGKGLWPHQRGPQRGENMCPLLRFPYYSPVVSVTDAYLDQRYWKALWEDVVFDAKAPQGTSASRVYDGRVRYYDMHYQYYGQRGNEVVPLMLMEVDLRLRRPVMPTGDIFPGFLNVGPQPDCLYQDASGAWVSKKLTEGYLDLPVAGQANDVVVLTPGLRVNAQGRLGFAQVYPDNGPLPARYSWTARWVRLDTKKDFAAQRRAMGLSGPTPYTPKFSRGKMDELSYVMYCTADNYGLAGEVTPYPEMPFPLTLCVAGVSANWPCGVWQPNAPQANPEQPDLTRFGVFERRGWARLDVKVGGPFYVGNLVTAGDERLRLELLDWTPERLVLEVHNPTDDLIETTLRTAREITNRLQAEGPVKVEPGSTVTVQFPQQ